jgi:hypothetical protein
VSSRRDDLSRIKQDQRMDEMTSNAPWEIVFAELLGDLSAVQNDLLHTLSQKRAVLMRGDGEALALIGQEEERLVERLQQCQLRRLQLLARANDEGRPADNLRALARSLPPAQHRQLAPQLDQAAGRARALQHECLTDWVVAQRTLIHLSQLLEIIATGGRLQPTYGRDAAPASGALLNQVG